MSVQMPSVDYVVVDLEDMFQNYSNLDPKVRQCEPLAGEEMPIGDAFEIEIKSLFDAITVKGRHAQGIERHVEDMKNEIDEMCEWDGNNEPTEGAEPTVEEQEIVEKYAQAMSDLGYMLHDKIQHLDLHDPDLGVIDLEVHSVVQNRFLLLVPQEH